MAGTAMSGKLEELTHKYGYKKDTAAQVDTHFDKKTEYSTGTSRYKDDKTRLERASKAPKSSKQESETAELHREFAGINLDLAELAETYGKLNVKFTDLLGIGERYTTAEAVKVKLYELVGRKHAAREIKLGAATRKGEGIETLVNSMAEVLGEQYETAKKGKKHAEDLQVENIGHMKYLDGKLIESLRGGHYSTADLTTAESEINKLESELGEIDGTLGEYEAKIKEARNAGDVASVQALTDEMSQILNIKHDVIDGKLAADGLVSDIRRELLDFAEGSQSSKGAIAASKVNYYAISALIDSMNELEIKYRHAQEDMIPVFKIQGKVAAAGLHALDMKDTLEKIANISQHLMEANATLVTHLAAETFDLLQTKVYDPEKAAAVEKRIRDYMTELNKNKMEWAEQQQALTDTIKSPHYAQHS